ncbi:SMC-Scp complex subunit ScpB [Brevibacterium album]|uniref:SMC-Scp complex subunit ScpB n=1 Tax=Brevibacterium album TaxID=417948 RepID=UPI00040B71A4|nr:SMC-Scp complex subunit ScpB [Brevibacterium album]
MRHEAEGPGNGTAPELLTALEAILMVTDRPVGAHELAEGLGVEEAEVSAALEELAADFDGHRGARARGFRLARAAGGWRIYTRAEQHDAVAGFLTAGQSAKLSQAALETLAIIAYRQPVTRARVSAIRGVNVDGVVRTLLMRGLIVESGTEELTGAVRFVTTPAFLEAAGLGRIEDLPDIAPFLPEGDEANRTGEAGAGSEREFGIIDV